MDKKMAAKENYIRYACLLVGIIALYFLFRIATENIVNTGNAVKIDDWTIRLNGVGMDNEAKLDSKDLVMGDVVVLCKSIAMGEECNTVCFASKNAMIRVFFDSKLIYSYGDFDSDNTQFIGTEYHIVSLKDIRKDGWAQPLKIEYHIITPNQRDIFSDVYIGNAFDAYLHIISENLENFVLCILVLGIGVIFIFFSLVVGGKGVSRVSLLFLAMTIICIGCWGVFRTGFVTSFLKTNYYFYKCAEYISLLLSMTFLLIYYCIMFKDCGKRIRRLSLVMVLALVPYQIFVFVSMVRDAEYFSKLVAATYVLYAVVLVLLMICCIIARRKNTTINTNTFGIVFLAFTVIYNIIGKYFLPDLMEVSINFLQYGMLIFSLSLLYGYLLNTMMVKEIYQKNEILSQIAYIDALTFINNRAKYEMDIKEYTSGDKWGVIFYDLNGLKKYNDEFGHEKGDLLINRFAGVLKKSVRASEIYRIGGDEFLVMLRDVGRKQIDTVINKINTNIELHNEQDDDIFISVAYGVEDTIDNDLDIETAVKLADEKMYEMKKKMKMNRE